MALLFQLAAWTTLQLRWLHVTVTIALLFLERALHSTLPPVATAAIAHAFKEYCGDGGGGSADFAASAAPYVFASHLVMGVQLAGSAPSRFGAGGDGGGGPSGLGLYATGQNINVLKHCVCIIWMQEAV